MRRAVRRKVRRRAVRRLTPMTLIGLFVLVMVVTVLFHLMPEPTQPPAELTPATVQRVIDGDTVVLTTGERVRFIGIDAPEIGEPGADEATEFVRSKVYGRTIWLEASTPDTDRFGRLRRYIWLQVPNDTQDPDQRSRYQLNTIMVENGLARVMIIH